MAAAAGIYTLAWLLLADRLRDDIARWTAGAAAGGWTVAAGALDVGGFPFSLRVRTGGVTVTTPRWRWRAPGVTAAARPWAPGRIRISAPGAHRLEAGGGLAVEASGADMELVLGDGAPRRVRLAVAAPLVRDDRAVLLRAGAAEAEVSRGRDAGAAGWRFALSLRALRAAAVSRVLDAAMEASAEGAVLGLPRAAEGPLARRLAEWRAGGGVVELESLAVAWGPLAVDARGTLALDRGLQPEGALTADVTGLAETARALAAAGAVSAGAAAALTLLQGAAGGTVSLPVTVQGRSLGVGPLRLLRLPPLRWD